jgi:hypothetical protein
VIPSSDQTNEVFVTTQACRAPAIPVRQALSNGSIYKKFVTFPLQKRHCIVPRACYKLSSDADQVRTVHMLRRGKETLGHHIMALRARDIEPSNLSFARGLMIERRLLDPI